MAEVSALRRVTASVRFRTTLVAITVVTVVLGVAVFALAQQTRVRVEASIANSAESRAADLAGLLADSPLPDVLPAGSRELFSQVIAADGSVLTSSPGIGGLAAFTDVSPAPGVYVELEAATLFEDELGNEGALEDEGPYLLVVTGATGTDGRALTVVVAASLEPAEKAEGAVLPLLLVGFPLVVLLVGVTVWALTGRALRPVERMRAEADAISAAALDRRLPVPPSHDEINRLASTLNAMLDRLESSAAQRRRFVADASHELKSPVAAIRAMVDVAADDPDFDDWPVLLADLRREDRRLERMVEDMLTLARSDEGGSFGPRSEIDLDRVVGTAAETVRAHRSVAVDTSGLMPARIVGSERSLDALFRNLLDNAARHAHSQVWVSSQVLGSAAAVMISDDGPGIAAADRERIFDRFVRLDEARARDDGGTGLGLAVARAVARGHGGDVEFVDPSHDGATVRVTLPIS